MIFPGINMPTTTKAQRVAKDAAFEKWASAERERVRRQRAYLSSLKGPLQEGLVGRMLERAWYLLDAGEAEAADALLEFVPEAAAEKLLRDFFPEIYEDAPALPAPVRTRMKCVGDLNEQYVAPPSIRRWAERKAERGRGRRAHYARTVGTER